MRAIQMRRLVRAGLAAAAAGLLLLPTLGCSDDETGPEAPLIVAKAQTQSGDNQGGLTGEQLANALRVLVTRDEEPVEGVEVVWNAGGDGAMNPETSLTDADGIAESFWVLGSAPGPQSATARVPESDAPPLTFTATAVEPEEPPPGPPPGALRRP